jgi:hypothetical protein
VNARFVPVRYFFIALVPILIFYQESVITDHFLTAELQVGTGILTENWAWLETAGRFRFLGATWFFAALALMVFVLVLRDLIQPTHPWTRVAAAIVLVLILVLAMWPSLEYAQNPDKPRNYDRLGGALFEAALGRGSLPGCLGPDDRWLLGVCGERPVISLLNRMMDVINFFAGLGVGALIVGMVLCLEKQVANGLEQRAAQLQRNLHRMRRQLYLSGLVLTFGIFFATSWMRWPLPMVAKEHGDAYAAVISAASLYTGLYFSLLILSFYLPVTLILEGRRRKLIVMAEEDATLKDAKKREEWLKLRGLLSEPADVYKSAFALAAPILAAFAGNVPIAV